MLAIYIALIISLPHIFTNLDIKRVAQDYISPLGNLKSSYITFSGTSIGSFLAIFGAVWVQDKNRKKQREADRRKSALIIYYDFKIAFEDLLFFYMFWVKDGHSNIKIEYEKITNAIHTKIKTHLYLDSNWINNVANLENDKNSDFIEEVYTIYGDLHNMSKVVSGAIDDDYLMRRIINKCEKYYNRELLLVQGANWEVTVKQDVLVQLKRIVDGEI